MDLKKGDDIKRLVSLIDPGNRTEEWLKTLFSDVTKVKESEQRRFLDEMNADVAASLYYPVYDQYFSHDEIKELIKFYSSEIGCKLARYKSGVSSIQFLPNELDEIEQFKKTSTGRKFNRLSDKIAHQHTESVKKYIDSLR